MKIDFCQDLKTIYGDPLQRNMQKGGKIVQETATLRWAAVEALLTMPANANPPAEEKAKRYELAIKIQESNGSLDLGVEDVAFVKKLCDEHFGPLVMGQTRRMLEGEPSKEKSA